MDSYIIARFMSYNKKFLQLKEKTLVNVYSFALSSTLHLLPSQL